MKTRTTIITLSLLALAVGGAAFYWYSLRPAAIRRTCQREVDSEYTRLFDKDWQTQSDGVIMSKSYLLEDNRFTKHLTERIGTVELTSTIDAAIHTQAESLYEPCLRREGLCDESSGCH